MGSWTPHILLVGMVNGAATWENSLAVLQNVNDKSYHDSLLSIYLGVSE